jgi:hypothetical protein
VHARPPPLPQMACPAHDLFLLAGPRLLLILGIKERSKDFGQEPAPNRRLNNLFLEPFS